MSRTARAIAVAASAGLLAASGGAAAGASSTTRTVLPPRLFKPMLPRARAKSRLAVLLPSRIKVDLFAARGVVTGRLDSARAGHYELLLEDRHHRCTGQNAGRRPCWFGFFSGDYDPHGAITSGIPLAHGWHGYFTDSSGTGGGVTPPSITWTEGKVRYEIALWVTGPARRALIRYVNEAIRAGAR